MHTELRRLYGVDISREPLRTYLTTLDTSETIGADSAAKRRRTMKSGEADSSWLPDNEDRVRGLLSTLGVCTWPVLQKSIESHLGVTIGH